MNHCKQSQYARVIGYFAAWLLSMSSPAKTIHILPLSIVRVVTSVHIQSVMY